MSSINPRAQGISYVAAVVCMIAAWFPATVRGGRSEMGADLSSRLRNGPGITNHPVNVAPSAAVSIPQGWPLGLDGSITCTTCHASLPRLDGQSGAHLRGQSGESLDSKAFCANCHREDGPRTAASMHWMAVSKAHVLEDGAESAGGRTSGMDADSHSCLSCHDGVTAPDAGYETSFTRNRGFVGDRSRNHPVGMRYPRNGTRGVEVPLRPVSLLPKAISLPGGTVGCASCHNLYGQDEHRLAVPIEGSKLCMTCHVMD